MSTKQRFGDVTLISAALGDAVNVAATAIGDLQQNPGADSLLLHTKYTKGTEAGVYIYVVFPTSAEGTDLFEEGRWTDTGSGVLLLDGGQRFLLDADAAVDIPIDLRARSSFKVYQISNGAVGGGAGTIVMNYSIYG